MCTAVFNESLNANTHVQKNTHTETHTTRPTGGYCRWDAVNTKLLIGKVTDNKTPGHFCFNVVTGRPTRSLMLDGKLYAEVAV